MKKILTIMCLVVTCTTFGQSNDSTKTKTSGYISAGISLTNGDNFKSNSYSSIEAGIMRDNITLGGIFGRGSLSGINSSDNIKNYFYEIKTTASYPVGSVSGSILFGYGGYFNTTHNFIEYGVGITYNKGKMGYGVTYSNWDGVNYVTPSITFNF